MAIRSRILTPAILAAICAVLALAPPALGKGGTFKYQGPVNQPFVPSNTGFPRDVPSIEMKVVFRGKTPSVVPDGVVRVKGIYGPCLESNGCKPLCLDFNGVCDPPQCFGTFHDAITDTTRNTLNHAFKVKRNRKFSGTYRNPELDTPEEVAGNFMVLTGKVTKKSVTGTVHAHFFRQPGTNSAGDPRPAETCDTGVLTYTARR